MVAALPLALAFPPPRRAHLRAVDPPAVPAVPDPADQRFVLYDIPWDVYVSLNDALGDWPHVRVCYCEGTLELMSPGILHEDKKTTVARLVEIWALVHDVEIQGLGSMTYRNAPKERGAEPDECYYVGKSTKGPPHLAFEVSVSRSAIDQLSLYAGLGVRELWIWQDDGLRIFHLGKAGYREGKRSKVLPKLDVDELVTFARMPSQGAAVRAYWKRLRRT